MAAPILAISGPSGAGKTTVGRLLAATFEPSTHLQVDAFMPFVVSGWVEPWQPEAGHQNHVLGGAAASAAIQFAAGGYTVIFDGHLEPDGVDGLARMSSRRGVPLSYAVLKPDLATCLARAGSRSPGDAVGRPEHAALFDPELLAHQYARFGDLGQYERHVVDASGRPEEVAAELLSAFATGRLAVPPSA
jgi:AAA domain